jgi:hypothetical protein
MRTVRRYSRIACLAGALALLVPDLPRPGSGPGPRPTARREITFTKWVVTPPPPPAPQPRLVSWKASPVTVRRLLRR